MIPTSTLAVKPRIFPSTAEALCAGTVPAAAIGFGGDGAGVPAAAVDAADGGAAGSGAAELAGDGFDAATSAAVPLELFSAGATGSAGGAGGAG